MQRIYVPASVSVKAKVRTLLLGSRSLSPLLAPQLTATKECLLMSDS